MTKYKVSQYKQEVINLILVTIEALLPLLGILIIFSGFTDRFTIGKLLMLALPLVALAFLLLLPRILYSLYALSYTVAIADDGRILEKQFGNKTRELNVTDIREIKWSYLGTAPYGPINWISRKFRQGITENLSNLPNWVGAKNTFSWGPEFVNSAFPNFPKYPISPDVITQIQKFRPELQIQGMEQQDVAALKSQRSLPMVVVLVFVGIIFIWVGADNGLFSLPLLIGILSIIAGWWYWKKR